jgi:ATP phosphoribosyltransferase regulatory subunit HisZ
MRKFIFSALAFIPMLAFAAMVSFSAVPADAASVIAKGNDYAAVTSEYIGSSTWAPALEVRIDGSVTVHSIGDSGLTKTILYDDDKRIEWVAALYGKEVDAVTAYDRGGWVDMNGNGALDPGEE